MHKITFAGENFVLYDSADDQDNTQEFSDDEDEDMEENSQKPKKRARRLIIYTTDENLKLLAKSRSIYGDGTWSTAPKIFRQLYIIMGVAFGIALPLAFSLTTHRDTKTYQQMLSKLRDKMISLNADVRIKNFNIDFELAMRTAVTNVFGDGINIHMYYFHLCQALFRQIQKNCLTKFYSSEDLRDEFTLICCIVMCPPEKVINAYEELYATLTDEAKTVAEHLDKYYIRGKSHGRRNGPRFPIP